MVLHFSNPQEGQSINRLEIAAVLIFLIQVLLSEVQNSEIKAMVDVIYASTAQLPEEIEVLSLDDIFMEVFQSKGFRLLALCSRYQIDQCETFVTYRKLTEEFQTRFLEEVVPQLETQINEGSCGPDEIEKALHTMLQEQRHVSEDVF